MRSTSVVICEVVSPISAIEASIVWTSNPLRACSVDARPDQVVVGPVVAPELLQDLLDPGGRRARRLLSPTERGEAVADRLGG